MFAALVRVMLCPGSPYPHHKVPSSPSLSQRSLRSGGSGSAGSRGRVVTYRTETTTSTGIFGRKKRVEAFQCQFERSVDPSSEPDLQQSISMVDY